MQQFPATITPKAKGKQRSLGHNLGFFDQPPRPSGSAKGRPVRRPILEFNSVHQGGSIRTTGQERRILPLPKNMDSPFSISQGEVQCKGTSADVLKVCQSGTAYSTLWQRLDAHSSPSISQDGVDSICCRGSDRTS
ncbi:hypothetical protein P692DRAFT_20545175 [Suillus brevipes Sb2]|nr:hypothetical protein P692DRAFT_20545175 [Suillus brevipes Sb2]